VKETTCAEEAVIEPTDGERRPVCFIRAYFSQVDEVDEQILAALRTNARASLREIGAVVSLSPGPVKRRLDRLERSGVIAGYTVVVDYAKAPGRFEAFTEVRLPPGSDVEAAKIALQDTPEVEQVFTIAGDPDALIRLRVDNVRHLQAVVNKLRREGQVMTTKTMIVMDSWQRM
jgi:Lrp/AsnC family leucine-responsive transcriptional regulator